jgi:glycosyltransferase involved in cell wall biosynthesis
VIGAFGLLNDYKGFWHLLDVLKQVKGTELILISHSTKPWLEAQLRRDIKDLPVDWISRYMPEREVVRILAAKADILAFLYDETNYHSASGAVRLGLATGIPVLTSTAQWFTELGEAVHRVEHFPAGALRLLEDSSLRQRTTEAARAYCQEHSWPRIAARHLALWRKFEHNFQ